MEGYLEALKDELKNSIEQQEQEQDEKFNAGREDALQYAIRTFHEYSKLNNSSKSLPTKEQIYCFWVNCQWGGGVDKRDYWTGHEEGFNDCINFMIMNGYMELTDKGKEYIPTYK